MADEEETESQEGSEPTDAPESKDSDVSTTDATEADVIELTEPTESTTGSESEPADAADGDSASPATESAEIKATDIVFDCPYCGKSLAIDYRGAGLTIPCTDCGRSVEVPIPEGMNIEDIDATAEDKEGMIRNLRKSLQAAEFRAQQLESEVRELTNKREALEKIRSSNMYQFGAIIEKVGAAQKAMEALSASLGMITDMAQGKKVQ